MDALKLFEMAPGKFSLLLSAGDTAVDGVVAELGHEPNGYFWAGVARLLTSEAPALDGRFGLDPEAGMFCAYGTDREALEELAAGMGAVATDGQRMRELAAAATASGFDFDD